MKKSIIISIIVILMILGTRESATITNENIAKEITITQEQNEIEVSEINLDENAFIDNMAKESEEKDILQETEEQTKTSEQNNSTQEIKKQIIVNEQKGKQETVKNEKKAKVEENHNKQDSLKQEEIKTKEQVQRNKPKIKEIDRKKLYAKKLKDNIIEIKKHTNNAKMEDSNSNSPSEYGINRVEESIRNIKNESQNIIRKYGKKSVIETKNNIQKTTRNIRNQLQNDKIKKIRKLIRNTNQNEKVAYKMTKQTEKATKKAYHITKITAEKVAKGIKTGIQATVNSIKAITTGTRALTTALIAGGWGIVLIIIIISIIGGFVSNIFNGNEDTKNPSNKIVLVAKAQLGNEGGEKFWKWYGFNEHVEWCACFVSWCANECGYIDKGIIPKFSYCDDGINWFRDKEQWHDKSDSYYPMIGDLIFFDWKDDNGNRDNISDHVGIVFRTDLNNKIIYTIEGNTSNKCAERTYLFDDVQIMGYASPKFI